MANMKNKQNPHPENEGRKKHLDAPATDNDHQKTVQGKNQRGPGDKVGKNAGGNQGSKRQNSQGGSSGNAGENAPAVGSHQPRGDGPGTKTFKHEHDDDKNRRR